MPGLLALICFALTLSAAVCSAAETTGAITGTVLSQEGKPITSASVQAVAPAGRYHANTDASGRFVLLNVTPDTYAIVFSATGYATLQRSGVTVEPGSRVQIGVALDPLLRTIARVRSKIVTGIAYGQTTDVFTVTGVEARGPAIAAASGLATYARGSVQSAAAFAPGVQQDQFANLIVRGGKVDDVAFTYDAVPVPQALIAEPGGNVIGAQLGTTGVGYTTITTAGFTTGVDQGLAGTVDETPFTGTYPARTTLLLGGGITPAAGDVQLQHLWATPDLKRRFAFDARLGSQNIAYGDGHTFYPSEAATYGLSLATRAGWSASAGMHFALDSRDDLELLALAGESTYDQYGTPYAGERYGTFDGSTTAFPNEPSPGAQVTAASRIRGTYAIEKVQLVRNYTHAYSRVRLYRSMYGARTEAPFFDDLSFPNGVVSYAGRQSGVLNGFGFDVHNAASPQLEFRYGIELRSQHNALDQVVPTLDQRIVSNPRTRDAVAFVADQWDASARLQFTPALRFFSTRLERSDGKRYTVSATDLHVAARYRVGGGAFRVAYDHMTVPPKPLQVERNDLASAAPFLALGPERAGSTEISYERRDRSAIRITYFNKRERDRIDVIPENFRSTIASGESPATGIGIPQNVGSLNAHGVEMYWRRGGLSFSGTYVRAWSSSASQFALNSLNEPAIAAGHLFPAGYVPDFSGLLAFETHAGNFTITPALSYESGYPYGNGRMAWIFDANGTPRQVPNDNHVNPGYNYYFLRDPSQPFDAVTNPYVTSLGTPEGADPNTLRSTPKLLLSLRASVPLSERITAEIEIANALGTATPTQLQGNPYLIGPPGYTGGNSLYACYFGMVFSGSDSCGSGATYALGNGIPTNDGHTAAVPWSYGTAGYVPSSYPEARSVYVRLSLRL